MATPAISLVTSADSPQFSNLIRILNKTTIIALDAEWKSSSRCIESNAEWNTSSRCIELDAEWKPSSYPYVTLLQLACQIGVGSCSETLVFLLDLVSIPLNSIWGPLKDIFTSSDVLKLGFGFKQDLIYLHHTFLSIGCLPGFDMVEPYIDIRSLSPFLSPDQQGNEPKSLAAICKHVLKITLSKELQLSDWSHRPLTEEQIKYAAMDAYCLLRIFHVFQSQHSPKDEHGTVTDGPIDDTLNKQIDNVSDEKAISLMEIVRIHGDKIILKASDITPKLPRRKKAKKQSPKPILPDELSECISASWEGDDNPKFLCDVMVHGLAKHLRCVGIDAALPTSKRPEARELIEKASKEKRVLLTRDGKLLKYQYLVKSPIYKVQNLLKNEQLLEVIKTFKLEIREDQLMSRCAKCNGKFIQKPLTTEEAVEAAKGFQRIPSCLFNKNLEFWQCMDCKQLYWEGTQYHNAVQKFIDVCKLNE